MQSRKLESGTVRDDDSKRPFVMPERWACWAEMLLLGRIQTGLESDRGLRTNFSPGPMTTALLREGKLRHDEL